MKLINKKELIDEIINLNEKTSGRYCPKVMGALNELKWSDWWENCDIITIMDSFKKWLNNLDSNKLTLLYNSFIFDLKGEN